MANHAKIRTLIYLFFLVSGFSALIYEVVWFHLLRLAIGSSSVSLTILLVSFMGGMFIGSSLFGRLFSASRDPLKLYAALELAIGICGGLMLIAVPMVGSFYSNTHFPGHWNLAIRAAIGMLFLMPPTICMGATLPAIARWLESSPIRMSHLSWCYAANIFGGVIGTCTAGFYLLRFFDVNVATFVAVAANVGIAAVSFWLAHKTESVNSPEAIENTPSPTTAENNPTGLSRFQWAILCVTGICGMTSLGSQVIWTRLLSLLFGGTVYTFSMILSVFLVGLGIGSALGGLEATNRERAKKALTKCLLLQLVTLPYAAWAISTWIPGLTLFEAKGAVWYVGLMEDLVKTAVAILPSTLIWGASFPLALAVIDDRKQETGKLVGQVYAANTLGCIIGALVFGLWSIVAIGTDGSQMLLLGLATVGFLAFYVSDKSLLANKSARQKLVFPAIAVGISAVGMYCIPDVNTRLIAVGEEYRTWQNVDVDFKHRAEGLNTSVAISDFKGVRSVCVGGKIVASAAKKDMRLQKMLGHIPSIMHNEPKSALIVGFGAGVTAGTFTLHPSIERIVVVEIEPEVVKASGEYFKKYNNAIVDDPRVEIIFDDGRHFLATTEEKFDIITTDPIHPWVKGAAILYSKEFYELVKLRLNPNGIMTQWVPLYDTSEEAVKSELGTFFNVFEHGSLWDSSLDGKGYDLVALGTAEGNEIDLHAIQQRLDSNSELVKQMNDVDLGDSFEIAQTFSGFRADSQQWLADAELNTDQNLRLQYLAGAGAGTHIADRIYFEIIRNATFPLSLNLTKDQFERLASLFEDRRKSAQKSLEMSRE